MNVTDTARLKAQIERAFAFAQEQVRALVEKHPGFYPIYTKAGKWKHEGELWTDWCAGFLAGQMWLIAGKTGEAWWREKAEAYSRKLEHKNADLCVLNGPSAIGDDEADFTLVWPDGRTRSLGMIDKDRLANILLDEMGL